MSRILCGLMITPKFVAARLQLGDFFVKSYQMLTDSQIVDYHAKNIWL